MKYIEAPKDYNGTERSLFLAGGITGCINWQADLADLLKDEKIVLLNPRRINFPIDDQNAAPEQIKWEYTHLQKADAVSFWFPKETVCPITLYELGVQIAKDKPLFMGIDPEYSRRLDVEIQTRLERPEIKIEYNLNRLADQIKQWVRK